jgi:hypothetical protein
MFTSESATATYKKGDRVIVKAGRNEYILATITAMRSGNIYLLFDDGDKGSSDDIKDIVGHAAPKKFTGTLTRKELVNYKQVKDTPKDTIKVPPKTPRIKKEPQTNARVPEKRTSKKASTIQPIKLSKKARTAFLSMFSSTFFQNIKDEYQAILANPSAFEKSKMSMAAFIKHGLKDSSGHTDDPDEAKKLNDTKWLDKNWPGVIKGLYPFIKA